MGTSKHSLNYRGMGTYKGYKLYEVEDGDAEVTGSVGTRYCRCVIYIYEICSLPGKDDPIKIIVGSRRSEDAKEYIDRIVSGDLDRSIASARLRARESDRSAGKQTRFARGQ